MLKSSARFTRWRGEGEGLRPHSRGGLNEGVVLHVSECFWNVGKIYVGVYGLSQIFNALIIYTIALCFLMLGNKMHIDQQVCARI